MQIFIFTVSFFLSDRTFNIQKFEFKLSWYIIWIYLCQDIYCVSLFKQKLGIFIKLCFKY